MNEQNDRIENTNTERFTPTSVARDAPLITLQGCAQCNGIDHAPSKESAASAPAYVYALGRIQARFPNLAAEKEFAQVVGRTDTAGKTDQQTFHAVLSNRANRYMARQLCWVLSIQGMETYLLLPRDPADLDLLVDAIRPVPTADDVDVIIGVRGPFAHPQMCNGLTVPIVVFDQIYSFKRAELVAAIAQPESEHASQLPIVADELFDRIMQLTDNSGATDEHRALNYLAMRSPSIYAKTADAFSRDFALTSVEARRSSLSNTRKVLDVIFSYTNRTTEFVEQFCTRVDVTEEFPFMLTRMAPYYEVFSTLGGSR